MSEIYVNIGGTWKPVSSVHVNVGGAWKKASGVYQNVGGAWKSALITPEASGGTVTTDGDYKVHTFTSSGSFVVSTPGVLSEVLIVAGGGAGGWGTSHPGKSPYDTYAWGGGGGAGGKLLLTNLAVTPQTYTITVGGGGAISSNKYIPGNNGGNSAAFGNTAIGGGAGGPTYPYGHIETPRDGYGKSGGSGGGGGVHLDASNVPVYTTAGSGTSGQGYAGSNSRIIYDVSGYNLDYVVGGGGGGAGGAGSYSSSLYCGTGGSGYTFHGVVYAKGGDAKYNTPKGTAGSGGYGGTQTDSPQAGYAGIVIVRYKYK